MKEKSNPYLEVLNSLPKLDEIDYGFNAISLFSGGGGLDLGAAFAGFRILFASDIEPAHCATISFNFKDSVCLPLDINKLTGKIVRRLIGNKKINLLVGGPPCQSFSILGNRNSFKDPRGSLVYEYARMVKELMPEVFVFENVPGLLTLNHGKDWNELLKYFQEKTGYHLFVNKLNAADFGAPQIRHRIFIAGFSNKRVQFAFPRPTHYSPNTGNGLLALGVPSPDLVPWVPAKYALENLDDLANHRIRPHGDRVRNRYLKIPPGARDRTDHTDRIHPDRPSGTVIVGSRAGGGRPHIHPFIPRHITVREAARLQSFPDWYIFQSTETWQYRAVGNAVPPLLAKAVCNSIRVALENIDRVKKASKK
jgi:DNA (cytosine-5)-methyltransferase 1